MTISPAGVPLESPVQLKPGSRRLSFRDAMQSPCLSCQSSPCCTHLLLNTIQLKTIMDVDEAQYLANFAGITLVLGTLSKTLQVYLHQECRYLGPNGLCSVHSSPLQPSVCVHYSSHWCAYKKVFNGDLDPVNPLVDARRMAWLAEHIEFDEQRRVTSIPEKDEILEAFSTMPTVQVPLPPTEAHSVVEEWRDIVMSKKRPAPPEPHQYADPEVSDPCSACPAWCCQYLLFDREIPRTTEHVEHFRYSLGFPGVELAIGEAKWSLMVRTTCRHLDAGRCSLYGAPERPLRCSYFSATTCDYRQNLGVPRPEHLVRVRREHFEALAESVIFDDLGRVVGLPSLDLLRNRVEEAERARTGAAVGQ